MYIKNWLLPTNVSISSDALAIEALQLIREHNLKIIPVVDDGKLRGVLHRRDLSEAALCVSGSGEVCEVNYFRGKLKVKDLMVRMPITVSVDDTVESTLIKGKEMLMSSFPVLENDRVVGLVSDREIFVTLFKILEAGQDRVRVTLTGVELKQGTLSNILNIVDKYGGLARAIFTVAEDNGKVRVVLRFQSDHPEMIINKLKEEGFGILEIS